MAFCYFEPRPTVRLRDGRHRGGNRNRVTRIPSPSHARPLSTTARLSLSIAAPFPHLLPSYRLPVEGTLCAIF